MDNRVNLDMTMLRVAIVLGERSTCVRRAVGCVLTDRAGRILATGHNGVPRKMLHCTEVRCPGADAPSGIRLDECQAVHAEQNALMFCSDVNKIDTCYVTSCPCLHCVKMLMNTECRRIIYAVPYAHEKASRDLWLDPNPGMIRLSREWLHLSGAAVSGTVIR